MRLRARLAVAVASLASLAACQTERVVTSDGRPMPPKPRAVAPAPYGIEPNQLMVLIAAKADDSDGNGYPDRVIVTNAALFRYPEHPGVALEANGAMIFTLWRLGDVHREGAEPIAEWRFDLPGDMADAPSRRSTSGTIYRFALSLLDAGGSDRMPPTVGDLRARYEPASGAPVIRSSDEVRAVHIGGQR
ncbi:MAG: hypothetical protein GY715_12445 [Planctomycetes bacterium]|nr:hypothetical protein [Planctomycetota bacterium]